MINIIYVHILVCMDHRFSLIYRQHFKHILGMLCSLIKNQECFSFDQSVLSFRNVNERKVPFKPHLF